MARKTKGVKTQRHVAFRREVARIAKKRQHTEQVVPDKTKLTVRINDREIEATWYDQYKEDGA